MCASMLLSTTTNIYIFFKLLAVDSYFWAEMNSFEFYK